MASIIPPKQPRRQGMPKLNIPPRPSSSNNAEQGAAAGPSRLPLSTNQAGLQTSDNPHGAALASRQGQPTLLTGGMEQYHDAAYDGYLPARGPSIYPDTVPGPVTDQAGMTDELRRAIQGRGKAEEGRRIPTRPGALPTVSAPASSSNVAALDGSRQEYRQVNHGNQHSVASAAQTPVSTDTSTTSQKTTAPSRQSRPSSSSSDNNDMELKDNLETISRLGEGASGEVRKARHKVSGVVMAVKTIATSPNPASHRQILRELAFNRTCQSPYIVRYYGAFLSPDATSIEICMEFCKGGSLDAIYKRVKARNGRTGEKILGKVAEDVLKGLDYLHERSIIHRDIKPSNILVTESGQIKLCDFGVSGELVDSKAGTFVGTSSYMAPERIKGQSYTITSDVWSLGLTILEVASNRFPFPPEGEGPLGPIDLLSYIVTMKTPELHDDAEQGIKWSRALRDFIERCLEKNPESRPAPRKMLTHPFIRKSETRQPQPNVGKFVADVWEWPYAAVEGDATSSRAIPSPVSANSSAHAAGAVPAAFNQQMASMKLGAGPSSAHNSSGVGDSPSQPTPTAVQPSLLGQRMGSVRKAPAMPPSQTGSPGGRTGAATVDSSFSLASITSSAHAPPTLKVPRPPGPRNVSGSSDDSALRGHHDTRHGSSSSSTSTRSQPQAIPKSWATPPGMAPVRRMDTLGRSEAERLEARRREWEIGVVGSPADDD